MYESLWGSDFEVPETPKVVKKIKQKIDKPKVKRTNKTSKKNDYVSVDDLHSQLNRIKNEVYRILGKYKDNTIVIKTKEDLHNYITQAIENDIISIDTETNNSLDPITCKLMGACIYTPGEKNVYIPINHVDLTTKERLDWQLTEHDIHEEFLRLVNTKIITHNGNFDYQVVKCTTDTQLSIYWDTYIGAKVLNENEIFANLKQQYIDKIDPSIEKYDIEHLFEELEYAIIDPELFALYAATDAYMTYKLFEWQKKQFEKPGHERLYSLFLNVEMPVVPVVAEMELNGICIDEEYSKKLSKKYHDKLEALNKEIDIELAKYDDIIARWRTTPEAMFQPKKVNAKTGKESYAKSKSEQLSTPVSLSSPVQLAILIYDVLKTPVIDPKQPRGTGEDILGKLNIPLSKLILKQRGLNKLISTYIDKLPQCLNIKDHRIHGSYLQYGTQTGRFASKDPNLQNIPSHNYDIRMMFTAGTTNIDGKEVPNVFCGSDYSQQEPRTLAVMAQDDAMMEAYRTGRDLYATIAQSVYHNNYEDNLETLPDGTYSAAGDKRRSSCKSILLGLLYGRGTASIAEELNCSVKEAEDITNKFFEAFPKIKKWISDTEVNAKKNGYVEDYWGRRRRLPDIQLPLYEVKFKDAKLNKNSDDFNPLLGSLGLIEKEKSPLITKYETEVYKCKGRKQVQTLQKQAERDGIVIKNNGAFISQAERQCVNARIQGGAASLTKLAMVEVHDDPFLREHHFKLVLQIHDELIGECPQCYADECANRLTTIMKEVAERELKLPFKCDPTVETHWYEFKYKKAIVNEYKALEDKTNLDTLYYNHCEISPEEIRQIIGIN